MRCLQRENVQEHSLQVAVVAHALTLIKNKKFGGNLSPDRVALLAIYHDATEVLTGDMPTPVKYFSPQLREAYKAIEGHAANQLLKLLPQEFQADYKDLLSPKAEDAEANKMVKAADTICAYIKCLEEKAAGNNEFNKAERTIVEKIEALKSQPEVKYFVEHFIPSFTLTLDEMSQPLQF